jgi:hypothetical protein
MRENHPKIMSRPPKFGHCWAKLSYGVVGMRLFFVHKNSAHMTGPSSLRYAVASWKWRFE